MNKCKAVYKKTVSEEDMLGEVDQGDLNKFYQS